MQYHNYVNLWHIYVNVEILLMWKIHTIMLTLDMVMLI